MFEDGVDGPALAAALAPVVPAGLDDWELVEAMRAWERLASWVAAGQLAVLAEFARRRPRDYVRRGPGGQPDRGDPRTPQISEYAVDEVAAALRLSRPAAGARLQLAVELAGRLPGTAAALRAGLIDLPKARAVVDAVTAFDDRLAAGVEARVLPRAGRLTAGQLRAALAAAVLSVDPAAAEERHQRAVAGRQVTIRPLPDGMAELWALLPADAATAVYTRIDTIARQTTTAADHADPDQRSMDARRADALVAAVLAAGRPATAAPSGPAGAAPTDRTRSTPSAGSVGGVDAGSRPGEPTVGLRADVHLTVPAATALGHGDQPGQLAGHGPIPASMARRLAHTADTGSWRKASTDPTTGAVVHLDRTPYTPSQALADLIRARDRTCRFPGCRHPAHRCDLDHLTPWPDGPTCSCNLAALCRHHHRLKHQGRWQLHQHPAGTLTWTSPTGHHYTTEPPAA